MYPFKAGGGGGIEEVMINLCLFIGYEPHSSPKNLILVQKVQFSEIDHFDLLDFSIKILITSCQHIFVRNTYKCYIHSILVFIGVI